MSEGYALTGEDTAALRPTSRELENVRELLGIALRAASSSGPHGNVFSAERDIAVKDVLMRSLPILPPHPGVARKASARNARGRMRRTQRE